MSTLPQSVLQGCSRPRLLTLTTSSPKLMPLAVHSIEIIKGDGGVGSIKQINFSQGNIIVGSITTVKCIKNQKEELDPVNYSYKYSLIEEDGLLMDKIEKITYEVKWEATPEGGSKNKMSSTYYIKGDFALTDKDIKSGKEKAFGMYQVVEAYLLQNPDAYYP